MDITTDWRSIRHIFADAFRTSFHFSLATVTPEGFPHVTPIGSVVLREPGHAIYFQEFTRRMPRNLQTNQRICVLAVRSGPVFWLRSLLRGRFDSPPAIRLHGTVGAVREATAEELAAFRRRVRRLRFTRGYKMLWANMHTVRDIYFTEVDGIHLGEMTRPP